MTYLSTLNNDVFCQRHATTYLSGSHNDVYVYVTQRRTCQHLTTTHLLTSNNNVLFNVKQRRSCQRHTTTYLLTSLNSVFIIVTQKRFWYHTWTISSFNSIGLLGSGGVKIRRLNYTVGRSHNVFYLKKKYNNKIDWMLHVKYEMQRNLPLKSLVLTICL